MNTKNELMNGAKTSMDEKLSVLLGDIHLLYIKTLGFHWNVEDPRFSQLHALFEEQYTQLAMDLDVIAERIRKLGKMAPGSIEQLTSLSRLKEAKNVSSGDSMIETLISDYESLISWLKDDISNAELLGDPGTVDTLVVLLKQYEKQVWMLNSHLPN